MAVGSANLDGFSTFSICINKNSATHYLFIKQHQTREVCELKPQDRTLFIINVPPYLNKQCMERLFSQYGTITNVFFHQKPTANLKEEDTGEKSKFFTQPEVIKGYKVAYVVFERPTNLKKVLSASQDRKHDIDLSQCDVVAGVNKWCQMYNENLVNVKEMSEEIELFMANYDQEVEDEKTKAKELDGIPDDEGWVTVTKHSRKPVIPRTEAANNKISAKMKKKRSQKSLQNFYSFQIRESKMERLAQLRKKFQEDKEKIAVMKASRKFRPF